MRRRQISHFEARWAAVVHRLPTLCPPVAPTISAAVLIPLFGRLGLSPWLCGVGILMFALAPQWDSCIFGLMDFAAVTVITFVGLFAVTPHLAA